MKLLEELAPVQPISLTKPTEKRNGWIPGSASLRSLPEDDGRKTPIAWRGEFFSARSFAHVNRESALTLSRQGVPVRVIPTDQKPEPEVYQWPSVQAIQPLIATEQRADILIEFLAEEPPPPTDKKLIYLVVWESFLLPQRFVEAIMKRGAHVWVPSSPVMDTCLRAQIPPDKLSLIPHGVDLSLFEEKSDARPFQDLPGTLFLFSGVAHYRKGVDVAVRAFQEEFGINEPVTLLIKDAPSSYGWGANLQAELRALQDPRIIYLVERYSSQQMAALYQSVDIVLAPSRGEGFNIPIVEALACGRPVIATMTGVTPDLNGGVLPIDATPVIDPNWSERSPLTSSMWLAPSVASLRAQMRRLYEDHSLRAALSKEGIAESQRYAWSCIGQQMRSAIENRGAQP